MRLKPDFRGRLGQGCRLQAAQGGLAKNPRRPVLDPAPCERPVASDSDPLPAAQRGPCDSHFETCLQTTQARPVRLIRACPTTRLDRGGARSILNLGVIQRALAPMVNLIRFPDESWPEPVVVPPAGGVSIDPVAVTRLGQEMTH